MGKRKSYTLVEILIASAIFTAIVVVTVGTFTGTISFNGSATEDRVTRAAAQSFNDWLTRQIRASNTTQIIFPDSSCIDNSDGMLTSGTFCPNTVAAGTLTGAGFAFIESYDATKYQVAQPGSYGGVTAIIMPKPNSSGQWMYIGKACDGETDPAIRTSIGTSAVVPLNPCGANWTSAGQVLSAEVVVKDLKFFGISPQTAKFQSGVLADYGSLAQPYITWNLTVAPSSEDTKVTAYQTTITSRDYSFAFPVTSQ